MGIDIYPRRYYNLAIIKKGQGDNTVKDELKKMIIDLLDNISDVGLLDLIYKILLESAK
jgi:hypothetical protein